MRILSVGFDFLAIQGNARLHLIAEGDSVANSSKAKGDRAEREVETILRDLLGVPARRALGAGRKDDIGDIHGVPDTVIQVVNWKNVAKAVREKPVEAEGQRLHSRNGHQWVDVGEHVRVAKEIPCSFAATFVRLTGGEYRVVMTPEQWATMWREAQ